MTEIQKVAAYYNFKPHMPYRLSPTMERPELRNKTVVFLEFVQTNAMDIVRAKIALMNPDGSNGETWYVRPSYIISI